MIRVYHTKDPLRYATKKILVSTISYAYNTNYYDVSSTQSLWTLSYGYTR